MKKINVILLFSILFNVLFVSVLVAQETKVDSHMLTTAEYERLMLKPDCLKYYIPMQSGPLHFKSVKEGSVDDSTFRVIEMDVPSDTILIHGWLYLPLGNGIYPLVVLTNGGGDGSRPIKSMSDFIAPVFAHCGIAAFVHDKRGTGKSGGIFKHTTYEDYIRDAGNCAIYLSHYKNINPRMVGVMGASEGGRVAVIAACRYPEISFVISQAGTVVNSIDDRLYAQLSSYRTNGTSDSILDVITPLWKESFEAWASNDSNMHIAVNKKIDEMRIKADRRMLPFKKSEMDSIPDFAVVLPTWNSLQYDYLSPLATFNKPWLAIFGDADQVVPTQASIDNIKYYMTKSGNTNYTIAVLPRCGHTPVDTETKVRIKFEHLMLNWINENILQPGLMK